MTNSTPQGYKAIPGSERKPVANARPVGQVDPNEQIEVSVYLKAPANSGDLGQLVSQGRRLTREEYSKSYGASPEDIAKIEQFARDHDLTIVEENPAARRVILAGTAAALSNAFATELQTYETPGGQYRGRTGPLHVPDDLDQIVQGVFGLDNRPQVSPHLRLTPHAAATSYTPRQVAQLYDFPTNVNGAGQCIALIELGGGFKQKDLQTYFRQLGITPPKVTAISVDKKHNRPVGKPDSDDGEVVLDIEVAGAIASGAHIAVYFAPNTDAGFLDAVTQATHDSANNPSVISISWGSAEANWTAQAMHNMDQAFQAAAALGITVCCAAGDNGSSDGVTRDTNAHVDFPASSPYALGCGGTNLQATSEVVWNEGPNSATGGGVSDTFPPPSWQASVNVPPSVNDGHKGRGVPDVAGDADPQTGYKIHVDGQDGVFGGTSAVAPLWAALIALINQSQRQSVGYLNPVLYQNYPQLLQDGAFRDITSGNNGAYSAKSGYDACTGLGSPDGVKLLEALQTIMKAAKVTAV
jgi:kumamolisin